MEEMREARRIAATLPELASTRASDEVRGTAVANGGVYLAEKRGARRIVLPAARRRGRLS